MWAVGLMARQGLADEPHVDRGSNCSLDRASGLDEQRGIVGVVAQDLAVEPRGFEDIINVPLTDRVGVFNPVVRCGV